MNPAEEEVVILTACKAAPAVRPALLEMAKAAHSQMPAYKQLTPEQVAARERLKRNLGAAVQIKDLGPVASTANPYIHLLREHAAGLITLVEMQEAIDITILKSEIDFQAYEYKRLPGKPQDLVQKEIDFHAKVIKHDIQKQKELIRAFDDEARAGKHASFFLSLDRVQAENRGNLEFLREMLQRQQDRNPVYASRIRDAIMTHESQPSK